MSATETIETTTGTNGKVYAVAALREAFEWVQDSSNWKNPINRIVVGTVDELERVNEAVIFFTGAGTRQEILSPTIGTPSRGARDVRVFTVRVTAPGYYKTCGA